MRAEMFVLFPLQVALELSILPLGMHPDGTNILYLRCMHLHAYTLRIEEQPFWNMYVWDGE